MKLECRLAGHRHRHNQEFLHFDNEWGKTTSIHTCVMSTPKTGRFASLSKLCTIDFFVSGEATKVVDQSCPMDLYRSLQWNRSTNERTWVTWYTIKIIDRPIWTHLDGQPHYPQHKTSSGSTQTKRKWTTFASYCKFSLNKWCDRLSFSWRFYAWMATVPMPRPMCSPKVILPRLIGRST